MSESLINDWLDGELSDQDKGRFEAWLREDPAHLQALLGAIALQEDVRAHYRTATSSNTAPWRRSRHYWVPAAAVAAALLLAAFFVVIRAGDISEDRPTEHRPVADRPRGDHPTGDRPTAERPTEDPLVWVLAGSPQVTRGESDPAPGPFPEPVPQTRVTTTGADSSVRWGQGCVLQSGPGTALALRTPPPRPLAGPPRSVTVAAGRLVVHLEPAAQPVDIVIGDYRVRASKPADFTVVVSGPNPDGDSVRLSVTRGSVELLHGKTRLRTVSAGEVVVPTAPPPAPRPGPKGVDEM